MALRKATVNPTGFNPAAQLPYELRRKDFELAIEDIYDLLYDINAALTAKDLRRIEDTVRSAILSGMLSDALTTSLARHSRVLTPNRFHNGHPDLIPEGRYADDSVASGADGVEVKATAGHGAVDTHGARPGWFCVFRYTVDRDSEPAIDRSPTLITEILLANLDEGDFRRNERGVLGTRTASPNRAGLAKLRENWVYRAG